MKKLIIPSTISLSTINDFSLMQISSYIIIKLVQQRLISTRYSSTQSQTCAYRGDRGFKCAVGHCISDDEYSVRMEEHTVADLINPTYCEQNDISTRVHNLFKNIDTKKARLLEHFQNIHDNASADEWISFNIPGLLESLSNWFDEQELSAIRSAVAYHIHTQSQMA